MTINDYLSGNCPNCTKNLFFISGSFGALPENVEYKMVNDGHVYDNGVVLLSSKTDKKNGEIVVRTDSVKNISDKEIKINDFCGRIELEGNDYEVYTQFNSWQNESNGFWQKLVTGIKTSDSGIRTCEGATPMLAALNNQSGRIYVFHLFPNCRWKFEIYKKPMEGKNVVTILEYGFESQGLDLTVAQDETVKLPKLLFYECENKTDFDAYRLHKYFNEHAPAKEMPVLYNSWLFNFDRFTPEKIFAQIDAAAELGIEYFVIDAGWFGTKGIWEDSVGDWEEEKASASGGRLEEISERVRNSGMKFGLWFEPESAEGRSKAVVNHPQYYFSEKFLNFDDEEATRFITDKVSRALDKYKAEFVKFDFNKKLDNDPYGNGFYKYHKAQKRFVKALRGKYPHIYFSNCSSGGQRMELAQAEKFDSFWLSDNQSPFFGVNVIKNTLKRLPPNRIERWSVTLPLDNVPEYGFDSGRSVTVSCGDATWTNIVSPSEEYIFGFLTGGPCGFSCDLTAFSNEYKKKAKNFIEKYKSERSFYMSACAKVLCDTKDFTVLEYFDIELKQIVVQVFSATAFQDELTVYPFVDENGDYLVGDSVLSGKKISKQGITVKKIKDNDCVTIKIILRR